MKHSAEMHRCLRDCDVTAIRKLWRHIAPDMPQPRDDKEALGEIHYARTMVDSMPFKLRAYSHAWLVNNGWPTGLPDHLKPKAQRIYPTIKPAVGIAIGSVSSLVAPAIPIIRGCMENAVMECYADGKIEDALLVRNKMDEAKTSAMRKLFGHV